MQVWLQVWLLKEKICRLSADNFSVADEETDPRMRGITELVNNECLAGAKVRILHATSDEGN